MIALCLISTCLVLVLLFVRKVHWTVNYWKNAGLTHEPFSSYLVDYLFRLGKEDIFKMLAERTEKYGPVYGSYQCLTPVLRVSSRDGIKDALVRNFHNAHDRLLIGKSGSKLWDNNILVLDYPMWKTVRGLSSHVLTGSKLRLMTAKFKQVAARLTVKLEELATTNQVISTSHYAQGIMMDGIAAVTFSLETNAMENPNHLLIRFCTGIFNNSFSFSLLNTYPEIVKYLPFVHFPSVSNEKFFTDFASEMLAQRRRLSSERKDPDALDLWLEVQKTHPELTDDVLISQMFSFFVTGYELPAYTLMFALYLLACHPRTQEKVYEDIRKQSLDPDNISFEEYSKMEYLEAVIYETLRLYPTDYIIDRVVRAPCTVAEVPLEEGIGIMLPMRGILRDPGRFSEPSHFRPERFVECGESLQEVKAFGDGPKSCVGQRLAVIQLEVFIAAVLRAVRLEPADDSYDPMLEYQPELELQPGQFFMPFPKKDLKVKLFPRVRGQIA